MATVRIAANAMIDEHVLHCPAPRSLSSVVGGNRVLIDVLLSFVLGILVLQSTRK